MQMTLRHLRGGVLMRLKNPKVMDISALDFEINNAIVDISQRIRDLREDWQNATSKLDLEADKDVYVLPDDCEVCLQVERFDAYDDGTPSLSRHIDSDKVWQKDSTDAPVDGTWVHTYLPGGRLRLIPAPTSDLAGGLRLTYKARPRPLLADDDVPPLPEEIHECIIAKALERIRQYGSTSLAQPESFEQFRREQAMRLDRFLRPMQLEAAPTWGDDDEFYQRV
jgi:hypothetical protein